MSSGVLVLLKRLRAALKRQQQKEQILAMPGVARRCSTCSIDWPNNWEAYKNCPQCEGPTDTISNADPLDEDEARSLRLHCEFERFYTEREVRLFKTELEPAVGASGSAP